ncbi:MAG: hypothetical protein ACKOXB_12195 [Flavobacteriales bacterium]
MKKNQILATIIAAAVLLVPFRYAFIEADITTPAFTMAMFLLTIGGTATALLIALKSE